MKESRESMTNLRDEDHQCDKRCEHTIIKSES